MLSERESYAPSGVKLPPPHGIAMQTLPLHVGVKESVQFAGEVFKQLGGSQRVCRHEHTDVIVKTVNRKRLRKHETTWHAEQS